jgi:predicted ArsR family transcriptional regulator
MGTFIEKNADLPLWRATDPATSKAAAEAARSFTGEHERLILEALAAGPGTKDEIAARCGLSEQQVARRMHGLERTGRVQATGETRPSAAGRPATVWKATAASR